VATNIEDQKVSPSPVVEIHVARSHGGAAASGERDSRLSPEQIAALQQTISGLVSGFRPPEHGAGGSRVSTRDARG
jgi:hypothetical protein